ncbi:MAG TPA: hypothetical protein VIN72_07505 [Lutibacter sp.]
MYKTLFIILFQLAITSVVAQQRQLLLGTWIKTHLETNNSQIAADTKYLKYTFENDGKFYLSTDYDDKGIEYRYKLIGDILELNDNKLNIISLENDYLILEDIGETNDPIKIYFTKMSKLLSENTISQNDYYMRDNDTIYFENELIYPEFEKKNNKTSDGYILSKMVGQINGKEESYSFATFIVNTNGQISNIDIMHHIGNKYDSNLIKAIEKTNGMWTSPTINGKKVNVLKEITYHYPKIPNLPSTVTKNYKFIRVETQAEKFQTKYQLFYKEAVKQYLRGNMKSALNLFMRCENLTDEKINTIIGMNKCYKELNDSENYQNSLNKIQESKFSYILKD